MKGARALASGMLVLAASCAIPAISAAEEAGTATEATTTTTTTPADPASPVTPSAPTDPPPEGASGGDQSPTTGAPVGDPSGGSIGVPPAAPSDIRSARATPKAHKAASASVTMGDFFFSPGTVSVAVGDTVTWRNTGQAPHNAVADDGSFRTPDLNNGESASERFGSTGTFSYICTIHPQMKGTVRVVSASSGGDGGGGGGSAGASATGSGTSEASAVASPDAAGDASTLPATGMAAGALALVGLALLASGMLVRHSARRGL